MKTVKDLITYLNKMPEEAVIVTSGITSGYFLVENFRCVYLDLNVSDSVPYFQGPHQLAFEESTNTIKAVVLK